MFSSFMGRERPIHQPRSLIPSLLSYTVPNRLPQRDSVIPHHSFGKYISFVHETCINQSNLEQWQYSGGEYQHASIPCPRLPIATSSRPVHVCMSGKAMLYPRVMEQTYGFDGQKLADIQPFQNAERERRSKRAEDIEGTLSVLL